MTERNEIRRLKIELAEKNETADVFMGQVKKLQAENFFLKSILDFFESKAKYMKPIEGYHFGAYQITITGTPENPISFPDFYEAVKMAMK